MKLSLRDAICKETMTIESGVVQTSSSYMTSVAFMSGGRSHLHPYEYVI